MNSKMLAVNEKFCQMLCPEYDIQKAYLLAGVMLLDEYRLYQWLESGRPAQTIVDVGGHYGSFAVMAKILWPDSTVRVYEPHPYSAGQLARHTAGFGGVTIINAAAMPLGYAGATASLHLSPDANDGAHAAIIGEAGSHETLKVNAVRFVADLQAIGSPSIDVLKLDCEGMEGSLLEDMKSTGYINNVGFIAGEWHGFENASRIESALKDTHITEVFRHDWPHGAFFAWRR